MNTISQQHHGGTYVPNECLFFFVKQRRRGEDAHVDTFEGQRNSSKCPKAGEVINELGNLENLDIFEFIFERNFVKEINPSHSDLSHFSPRCRS